MAEAEVVEQFSNENPLAFNQAAVEELKTKHGRVPQWANRRWRSEHRGWRGLERVPSDKDDPLTKDVLKCLTNPIIDYEMQTQDGFVRHGDVVLCTQTVALKEHNDARKYHRATKHQQNMARGQSELSQEISRVSGGHASIDSRATRMETSRGPGITSKKLRGEK